MLERAKGWLLIAGSLTACGAPAPGQQSDSTEEESRVLTENEALLTSHFQPALPENTSNVQAVKTVSFYFCSFTIGTAEQFPPFPPQHLVWLRRQPVAGRFCPAGYLVLGSSYGFPVVDLARHPFLPAIVASFTTQLTPSGEAHRQLSIVQPSYATGAILHQSTLAAMAPSSSMPSLGNVLSGELSIAVDGTLTVSGEKNGLMTPTEAPPGAPNYVATYDFFLFNPNPVPTPTSIVTF